MGIDPKSFHGTTTVSSTPPSKNVTMLNTRRFTTPSPTLSSHSNVALNVTQHRSGSGDIRRRSTKRTTSKLNEILNTAKKGEVYEQFKPYYATYKERLQCFRKVSIYKARPRQQMAFDDNDVLMEVHLASSSKLSTLKSPSSPSSLSSPLSLSSPSSLSSPLLSLTQLSDDDDDDVNDVNVDDVNNEDDGKNDTKEKRPREALHGLGSSPRSSSRRSNNDSGGESSLLAEFAHEVSITMIERKSSSLSSSSKVSACNDDGKRLADCRDDGSSFLRRPLEGTHHLSDHDEKEPRRQEGFLSALWCMEPRIFSVETIGASPALALGGRSSIDSTGGGAGGGGSSAAAVSRRQYISCHLGRFMDRYWRVCEPSVRHHYELIQEGLPCRLYFGKLNLFFLSLFVCLFVCFSVCLFVCLFLFDGPSTEILSLLLPFTCFPLIVNPLGFCRFYVFFLFSIIFDFSSLLLFFLRINFTFLIPNLN